MSFVDTGGVSKISQLDVDTDKDWAAFGLTSVKEVVAGMDIGDSIYFDGNRIQKLIPGVIGSELITMGLNHNPRWGWVA